MEEIQKVRHVLASITAYLQQLASSGKHRLVSKPKLSWKK